MKKLLALLPLLSTASLFAQGTPQARESNWIQTLIFAAVGIIFFYFILWRPERKRRQALEKQRSSMKHGDKVTAMGIVGTIDKIQDRTVILKMVDGSKIEVLKGAISEVMSSGEEPKDVK
jgi:preprotein translocase subunit YajC